ncbi:MAG: hypothetical protein AABW92_04305 [Nanoarchaeota archaeon]
MNQAIDKTLYFLDWRNDLDLKDVYHNFIAVSDTGMKRILRPVIRGGIEGVILGSAITSLYTLLTGEFSPEATKFGAFSGGSIGALVDLVQYGIRWDIYLNAHK